MPALVSRALALLRAEPARASALLAALLAVLAAFGIPNEVLSGLGALLALVLGVPVRAAVVPVAAAAATTVAAAREAAATTAETLTEATVGGEGALTQTGQTIVSLAAGGAAHTALKALGVPRKVRSKAVDH